MSGRPDLGSIDPETLERILRSDALRGALIRRIAQSPASPAEDPAATEARHVCRTLQDVHTEQLAPDA